MRFRYEVGGNRELDMIPYTDSVPSSTISVILPLYLYFSAL